MYDNSRGTDRLIDLMLRSGDATARGQAASGAIWGRGIEDVGQIAAGAVQQYGEQKAGKKQAAALDAFVASDLWVKDPKAGLAESVRILGPGNGVKFFEGLQGSLKLQSAQTPAEARAALPMIARGFLAAPEASRPTLWKGVEALLQPSGMLPPGQSLGEYKPEEHDPIIRSLAAEGVTQKQTPAEIQADAKARALGTAEGTTVKPENPESVVIDGRAVMATPSEIADAKKAGRTVAPPAPQRAATEEKLYEVEIPGPNGTLIKTLKTAAEMRSGVPVAPKSTGNKPVTGAERQSLAYYNRAREAVDGIEDLENRVAKRSYASQEFNTRAPNVLKSEDQQVYDQKQRAFTEARLRKESGAAIPESEFANDRRTYWAQPGDSEATIKQKRSSRAKVLNGLGYSAGKAYEEYYGESFPKSDVTQATPIPQKVDPLGIR
jgi:hypothetical protein